MTKGWKWQENATRLHYFVDGVSLCRLTDKHPTGGCTPIEGVNRAYCCRTCQKRLDKWVTATTS